MLCRRIAIAIAASVVLSLLAATSASAVTFTVDSALDDSDAVIDGSCDTDGGANNTPCSLRAAIQEAEANNNSPGTTDLIGFSITGSTIQLAGDLPGIGEVVTVNGCSPGFLNNAGPCVGLRGLNTSTDGFGVIQAPSVTIRGLAITNVSRAIPGLSGSTGLTVRNNWFGMRIDETPELIEQGVQVTADDAVIGGTAGATGLTPADRNVFANATFGAGVGLDIFAGDDAVVQGNYFGTNKLGTAVAANDEDIRLGGPGTDAPSGTLIGGTQAVPGTCNGACNVISGATDEGIDLQGTQTEPADTTTIKGNFIGLNAAGTAGIPNPDNNAGIRVVNAPNTTIGGAAAGEGNYFGGDSGTIAISAQVQGAPDLVISNNFIGTNTAGTAALAPPGRGITLASDPVDPATVIGNTITLDISLGIDGIQAQGDGATIANNRIGIGVGGQALNGGGDGIRSVNLNDSTITGNVIGNAGVAGITLEGSDENTVSQNLIGTDGTNSHPVFMRGIQIASIGANTSTGNTIGSDTLGQENTISNVVGDPIEIGGDGNDGNVIAGNVGIDNGAGVNDLFIDLIGADGNGNGAAGPNQGIVPPDVQAQTAGRSVGLAAPGATVRAFNWAPIDGPSSLDERLGNGTADSRGLWQITHSPVATDGYAASQTTAAAGTSELALLGALDPAGGPTPGVSLAGPNGPVADTTPSFTLTDPTSDADFQIFLCATDAGLYGPCGVSGSVYTTAALSQGAHSVTVLAIDEAANVSAPVTRAFEVDTVAPSTTITKSPKKSSRLKRGKRKKKVTLRFTSSEPGEGGFQCQIDSKAFVLCNSGTFSRKLKRGKHTFRVRAFDAASNADSSLAVKTFRLKPPRPR